MFLQRPAAKELLKHKFLKQAKKTSHLVELIDRFKAYKVNHTESESSDESDEYVCCNLNICCCLALFWRLFQFSSTASHNVYFSLACASSVKIVLDWILFQLWFDSYESNRVICVSFLVTLYIGQDHLLRK